MSGCDEKTITTTVFSSHPTNGAFQGRAAPAVAPRQTAHAEPLPALPSQAVTPDDAAVPAADRKRGLAFKPPCARLNEPWTLGGITIPNRVVLAPLAGIGNWFVRLQAKRYGAGLAFSEMVSSHAIHYENRRTLTELLKIHPDEGTPPRSSSSARTRTSCEAQPRGRRRRAPT